MPLTDRVIIEPIKPPDKIGAIYVPDNEKPTRGLVVAAGPGRVSEHGVLIPLTVKVGDEVIFNCYTTSIIRFNGQDVCMIHENEINCIVKTPTRQGGAASPPATQPTR
jgi:chaperonin GroES